MVKFELKKLPYSYDALVPYISKETLLVHYDKHHQAYCDKFNASLEELGIDSMEFSEIFKDVSDKPAIRNNGGGFWNHNFYWESMSNENNDINEFSNVKDLIDESFGSFERFKDEFSKSAGAVFGSGWTWLAVNKAGKLFVHSTPNQDNFMMDVCEFTERPILVIDVWEHAYYLDYQNRRPEYIENFFNVINWQRVSERLSEIKSS